MGNGRTCDRCEHSELSEYQDPCSSCSVFGEQWKPKVKSNCSVKAPDLYTYKMLPMLNRVKVPDWTSTDWTDKGLLVPMDTGAYKFRHNHRLTRTLSSNIYWHDNKEFARLEKEVAKLKRQLDTADQYYAKRVKELKSLEYKLNEEKTCRAIDNLNIK